MSASAISRTRAALRQRPKLAALLSGVAVVVVWYLWRFVSPYASFDPAYYDYFWPWRYALWAHLAGGLTALLVGPVQLWLGLTRQRLRLHRLLGRIYLGAALLGLSGASYLIAKELPTDWVFAGGLLGLACAWTLTTGMGYLAIRRRRIEQHQEWMIRSYVVASAFVLFGVFVDVLHAFGVHGPKGAQTPEELKLAAWICWSIPLLVTEVLIQLRHLRNVESPGNTLGTRHDRQWLP
ncbi:MAG TPA: DUF2306 domain-containing protein [Candidatus Dormibacteraeota bacterium]|nr:DUF2306 domain-containing protein [Candidatus Dormibacteraeota bacterium]